MAHFSQFSSESGMVWCTVEILHIYIFFINTITLFPLVVKATWLLCTLLLSIFFFMTNTLKRLALAVLFFPKHFSDLTPCFLQQSRCSIVFSRRLLTRTYHFFLPLNVICSVLEVASPLIHKFVCLSLNPRGLWEGTSAGMPTSPLKKSCRKDQNRDIADHLKKTGERWGMGQKRKGKKGVLGMQVPDFAELGIALFSVWSIHGWTLWHLICGADETLPCLNWSGFVSSLLSHDPLLYGSVRDGGMPLEYTALVGLLFASCRPTERMLDWSYFMLGLTLSSFLLHHISCSLLFLPLFSLSPTTPPIPQFLKLLMQQEGRKASVTLWNYCDFHGGPAIE